MHELTLTKDDIDFQAFINTPETAVKVLPAAQYARAVRDYVFGENKVSGAALPWSKTFDKIRFRPQEVTLWLGMNGHGKSMMTSHAMLDFLFQGEKVCIASFEMKPVATLKRMARQVTGTDTFTERALNGFMRFCQGRLWLYDQQGTVDTTELLAIIRYCSKKLGIQHFVVDSLMKCVKGEDDYNGQKNFVDEITAIARDCNIHIHLIHHSRKLSDEFSPPGKMDAKGSGSITDQVDQVLTVWRNKRKEAKRQAKPDEYDPEEIDCLLICDKNRHGEWEGKIGLFFHAAPQSYSEHWNRKREYDLADYMTEESVAI